MTNQETARDPDWPASTLPGEPANIASTSSTSSTSSASGQVSDTGETARAGAQEVSRVASQAVSDVAGDARQHARAVADEVQSQARDLLETTRVELRDQAQARTERAAEGLRTISGQARALAEGRPADAGQLGSAASELQQRLAAVADRLESGGVDGVLRDTGDFARRRPLVFLAACAGAGFVLGRMVRTARAADNMDERHRQPNLGVSAPNGAAASTQGRVVEKMSGAVPSAAPGWGNAE